MNDQLPTTASKLKGEDAIRRQQGREIAATYLITQDAAGGYSVPSQSRSGYYRVRSVDNKAVCGCKDFALRNRNCKHIYAVLYFLKWERLPAEQRAKVQEKVRVEIYAKATKAEAPKPRATYSQNWPAYNQAQMNEQAMFGRLLRELCDTIVQPPQEIGRPRLPLSDMVYAAATQVYFGKSGRRNTTNIRNAQANGQLDVAPSYATIARYLRKPELTSLLHALIQQSALPLNGIEHHFSPDSSGFSTSVYDRWFDEKWGRPRKKAKWIKAHIISGSITNVVAAAQVTDQPDHDTNFFGHLVNTAAMSFDVREVSADMAYSTRKNLHIVDDIGSRAFIPFKSNARAVPEDGRVDSVWKKAYHYYHLNREEFNAHYHQRSNVEASFAMIKSKFGAAVRSKAATAQINEVLCKILCHNICVLIQSMFELDIVPVFEDELSRAA